MCAGVSSSEADGESTSVRETSGCELKWRWVDADESLWCSREWKRIGGKCSSDIVNLDPDKAVFSGFMGSGAEVTHGLGTRDSGFTGDMVISSTMVVIEPPILKEVSPILCRHPQVVQNSFSPLSNLGNGMEAMFGERETHEEEQSSPHDDTTQQRLVDSIREVQTDSRLHILPWETSGVNANGSGSGER